MPSTIATSPRFKFFDANGNPAAYYLLNTYAAGSLTPKTTWKNQDQSTANTNPITLDANGECILWLDDAQEYKFVLTTPLGSVISTDDNISGGGRGLESRLAAASGASLVGFSQALPGAVQRTAQDKLRDIASVKDFGAVGDGVTDDTAAIQAALSSAVSTVKFTDGSFKVSSTLISSADDRHIITAGGKIIAATAEMTVLQLSGDGVECSINIDGVNLARVGIEIEETATNYSVSNSIVKNIRSATSGAFAIFSTSPLGGNIENNEITNVYSVGNGGTGDTNGMARGVQFLPTTTPTGITIIRGNRISEVLGEEGDSISVQVGSVAPFPNSLVYIESNTIINFSRRAMKIQGSRTVIDGNTCRSTGQSYALPNALNTISLVASNYCTVTNNLLDLDNKFFGINSDGSGVTTVLGNTISSNRIINPKIFGVSSDTAERDYIHANYIRGTNCAGVSLNNSDKSIVIGNQLDIEVDNAATVLINLIGDNSVAIGNVSVGASAYRFIRLQGIGCVVKDNHALGTNFSSAVISGPGTSSAALARGTVISGNTTSGTGALLINLNGGETYISENANRSGAADNGPNARVIWTDQNPETGRVNLYHARGTVAYSIFPSAGGSIGWVCITAGTPGTWKTFGSIAA